MNDSFEAWPFPVLKPEAAWSEFDRDFVNFMKVACAEGFKPRHQHELAIAAENSVGRSAFLVFRGSRNGWEPFLADGDQCVRLGPYFDLPLGENACVCVRPPFRAVSHLALAWLWGKSLASLLEDFTFVGGYLAGIQLRPEQDLQADKHESITEKLR
jgi:hypothetical protein